jgi:hypothetical protein
LFRTYPKGYKPPDEEPSEYQTIPLNKIEDFGVHCKQYYSLDVQYFKSAMDKVCSPFFLPSESVVDLDSLNPEPGTDPDPAFQVNPDMDPEFDDYK